MKLNQIDHVLVNKVKEKLIQDIKNLGGTKYDSDHFLVKVTIKKNLITTRNKFTEKLRWNISNLTNPKIFGAYSKRLNERLNTYEEQR